jgi:cytochrome c
MKKQGLAAALALVFTAVPAFASQDLARKSACLACHDVDRKIVGPAFKEVANKYRGDAKAEGALVEKVKKGSVGVWGQVPMPPNASVKDEDARTLVKWILSLK